jgi:undecaprenyl-diphosphatase
MKPVRLASVAAFMRARLSPEGHLGLHLTVGALLMVAAAWMFGGIAEDVVTADTITVVDVQLAQWFHAHATPFFTRFMLVVTHLHGTLGIGVLCLLMAAYLMMKKDRYWLLALAVSVPGGMLLNVLMKHAFQRARPHFDDPLLNLSTYSFPSGHTAGATLFYGVLAAYLFPRLKSWPARSGTALSAVFMVALVGLSRMYLGVHYLSDVLAAAAESTAWLALCLTGMTTWQRRQAARLGR